MISDTILKILSVEPTTVPDLAECIPAKRSSVYVAVQRLLDKGMVVAGDKVKGRRGTPVRLYGLYDD